MKRTIKIDPFFDKQPPLSFLNELRAPYHIEKPAGFGIRETTDDEICVCNCFLDDHFPDPNGVLETIKTDFNRFLSICGVTGNSYPIRIVESGTDRFEAYSIDIRESETILSAADTEGIRRGLIYLEDELRRREGPYLPIGAFSRKPVIHSRITRCFFSPINRPPKYGDELSDDIDYYPDEYLNRIMHDGANGVWIYSRFSDLIHSFFIPEHGKGSEARIEKLNRVIRKCARYGVQVYLFAIEPMSLTGEEAKKYPQIAGAQLYGGRYAFCTETELGRAYCREAGRKLFELCPDLGGFISITYGERGTSCASAYGTSYSCPRCSRMPYGTMLAEAVDVLMSGMKEAKPSAKLISWTYGHRLWDFDDIRQYIRELPEGIIAQQNFDDMGYEVQLDRERMAVDYWLSYVGPSDLFRITAEEANRCNKPMFAKAQVCCSHEIASVPYIPVPGILWQKYKGMRRYHVEGVMQCWYFGNFPSLMSKAAGELAFEESFDDETRFLRHLAATYWGYSKADAVVRAWKAFEKGYREYPINVMFSYYGPMHDGPVWKLWLKPKNYSLSRSWQTLDPVDGDRICEALLCGHTLDEAVILTERMTRYWNDGLKEILSVSANDSDKREEVSVARTIGLLFESGHRILRFYQLRDLLGQNIEPQKQLNEMRSIVGEEIKVSEKMIELCNADGRLGYHSEGEGYKFFPEKLIDRIKHLEWLLETEFPEVQKRISDKKVPLAYYLGEEDDAKHYQMGRSCIENAEWTHLCDNESKFRAAYDEENIYFELFSPHRYTFKISNEFKLLWPDATLIISPDGTYDFAPEHYMYYQIYGERKKAMLARWHVQLLPSAGTHLLLSIARKDAGWDGITPMKASIAASNSNKNLGIIGEDGTVFYHWCHEDEPIVTLGKNNLSPGQFGWLMP